MKNNKAVLLNEVWNHVSYKYRSFSRQVVTFSYSAIFEIFETLCTPVSSTCSASQLAALQFKSRWSGGLLLRVSLPPSRVVSA